MSCAVKGCRSAKRFKPEGIHFHRFPRGRLLAAWKEVLQLGENWHWTPSKYVCSKHFRDSDCAIVGNKEVLRLDAVPVIENRGKSPRHEARASTPSASTVNVVARLQQSFVSSEQSTANIAAASSGIKTSQTPPRITDTHASSRTPIANSDAGLLSSAPTKRKKISTDIKKNIIKVEKSSGTDATTSTDSSTKKRRSLKWIQVMHNYGTSPNKVKKKFLTLREKEAESRRKLYTANRAIKTLSRKIISLNVVIDDLKKKNSHCQTMLLPIFKNAMKRSPKF